MINWWFWVGDLDYERDCYLRVPLESQTTGPQTTILPSVEEIPTKRRLIQNHLEESRMSKVQTDEIVFFNQL